MIEHILHYCETDYKRTEYLVKQAMSFENIKALLEQVGAMDSESMDRLTSEFKRFTLETKPETLQKSLFNYLEDEQGKTVTKSFLNITVEPSNEEDQQKLNLKPTEPVGVMEGIFFLDDGTPFEVSNMRVHYHYMNFNTFVNLGK